MGLAEKERHMLELSEGDKSTLQKLFAGEASVVLTLSEVRTNSYGTRRSISFRVVVTWRSGVDYLVCVTTDVPEVYGRRRDWVEDYINEAGLNGLTVKQHSMKSTRWLDLKSKVKGGNVDELAASVAGVVAELSFYHRKIEVGVKPASGESATL